MLREDGVYCVYLIEHKPPTHGKWVLSNLDHFGSPKGFGAGGECWQKLGIYGVLGGDVLGKGLAREGLNWIRKQNEDYKFRLVMRFISQYTMALRD